jgi:PIN domain nuclease of toxin-antitoxin system
MAIFDAEPLVAILLGEPGGLVSAPMLADRGTQHAICALNAAEVVNIVARRSASSPRSVIDLFEGWIEAGLRVVPLGWDRARRAAELRSVHYHRTRRAVSLVDCGAIALAERLGQELVTSDPAMIHVARAEGVAVLPVPDSSGRTPK